MTNQAHQMIHDAVNKALQETGDLTGTYAALCVALKTVEVLYARGVHRSVEQQQQQQQQQQDAQNVTVQQ